MNDEKIMQQVMERIKKEYQEAIKKPYIRNPIAWAIYRTWKHYNRQTTSEMKCGDD